MGMCVVNGAVLQCSCGTAPSNLMVLPEKRVFCSGAPMATIMTNVPMVNVLPFGMCQSLANPTVAAATAAALGVLTPMPCIPVLGSPWFPGHSALLIGEIPALSQESKLMCAYGGVISIVIPGYGTVFVN